MANTYKVLGQSYPVASTLTALYTVPGATSAVCSTLIISNQSLTNKDYIRVSVAVAGAADTAAQYIYGGNQSLGVLVNPNNPLAVTLGFTLGAADVIRVYSLYGTCSFNLFGQELT